MLVKGVRMEGVPSHGREGGEKAPAEHMEGEGPRWGSGGELSGPGAEPEVFCTPRPGVHDHYQRTQRELTSRNQLGGCGQVQPLLLSAFFFFFFFFFFCGSGRRLCRQCHEKPEEGDGLPALTSWLIYGKVPHHPAPPVL